ncbi:MAG: NAD(P)/FAD-dependent oxidoreductase [Pseudomonadales bacterium]|nr:NAD(P)/FAD-dependent oxidoreductase [Pseudomonadales bacterium]
MEAVDAVVVGGGVVGLAIAQALSLKVKQCVLLEKEADIGMGVSGRNSGVIHAGLYYPTGSRKTQFCVRGRQLLYAYCQQGRVPHQRCGKLVVATKNEKQGLEKLFRQGLANGVDDLLWLENAEIQKLETRVKADFAIYSPSTGIVDAHALMQALRHDFEQQGGIVLTGTRLERVSLQSPGYELHCRSSENYRFYSDRLVNAAGLSAWQVAAAMECFSPRDIPPRFLCKGAYFRYTKKSPFKHLVYPLPPAGLKGLGIHATLDLNGQLRFGPNASYTEKEDYRLDEEEVDIFYTAIRQYFPDLEADSLVPDFVGIRPKLVGEDDSAADFMIQTEIDHQCKNLVNLFGIESPGLTASMAIAEDVCSLLV